MDREEHGEEEGGEAAPPAVVGRYPEQADQVEGPDRDRLEPVDRQDRAQVPVLEEREDDRHAVRNDN